MQSYAVTFRPILKSFPSDNHNNEEIPNSER